jgi:hypothetical protein
MNYGNVLPLTGAGIGIGAGYVFGVSQIIMTGVGIVLIGIVAYRYGSRLTRRRRGAGA